MLTEDISSLNSFSKIWIDIYFWMQNAFPEGKWHKFLISSLSSLNLWYFDNDSSKDSLKFLILLLLLIDRVSVLRSFTCTDGLKSMVVTVSVFLQVKRNTFTEIQSRKETNRIRWRNGAKLVLYLDRILYRDVAVYQNIIFIIVPFEPHLCYCVKNKNFSVTEYVDVLKLIMISLSCSIFIRFKRSN